MRTQPLTELHEGQFGTIFTISACGNMRRRLLDLGFTPGTQVECLIKSPYGDLAAYFIRGTSIALRSEDSADILVSVR